MAQIDFEKHKYYLLAVAICVIYLVFGYAAQLLCNFISIVYPAYISIKAIESKDKIDDTQWLTYWVLYAVFSIVEFFSIVVYSLIPCYYLLKCVFFIWCMLPIESNGSSIMYNKIIRPYFLKHQAAADECIEKLQDKAKEIVSDVLKKAK